MSAMLIARFLVSELFCALPPVNAPTFTSSLPSLLSKSPRLEKVEGLGQPSERAKLLVSPILIESIT
jgi:hypothetical protein